MSGFITEITFIIMSGIMCLMLGFVKPILNEIILEYDKGMAIDVNEENILFSVSKVCQAPIT